MSIRFSKNSNFQELIADAPPQLQGMARNLGDKLLGAGQEAPVGCTVISVAKSQSLAAPINAKLRQNGTGCMNR